MLIMRKQLGFTLVELLVVMAIIGILSTFAISNFSSAQARARDARRKSDLTQIQKSLEQYLNDYGMYPLDDGNGRILGCWDTGGAVVRACLWGEEFMRPTGAGTSTVIYMAKLPSDPKTPGVQYAYRTNPSGTKYQIFTRLENAQDIDADKNGDKIIDVNDNYGVSCGSSVCNFGLSSTNTTPGEDPLE